MRRWTWTNTLAVVVAVFLVGVLLAHLTSARAQVTPGRPQVVNVQHISAVTHVAGLIQAAQSGIWSFINLQHITSVVHVSAAGTPWPVNMALATRCVNTGGTAFEACGGAGSTADAVNVFHQSTVRHVSSVTHVGGTISLVNQAGTYATFSGGALNVASAAGQSGIWTIQALHQAVVSHVSSVTHITAAGPLPVVQSAQGALWNVTAHQGTASTTPWPVTAQQGGTWTVQAAHQGGQWNIAHITSVSHVLGSMQLTSQAGTVATFSGTALNVALTGNIAHIQSVMAHVIGTVTVEGRGTAGTATGGVATVQGANNMVPLTATVAHVSSVTHVTSGSNSPLHVVAGTGIGNFVCHSTAAIATSASGIVIHSVLALNRIYICAITLVASAASNVSLVEGTGANCGTGTAAMIGSSDAANGMAFSANGGLVSTAPFPWLVTQTAGNQVCLLVSAGRVSGMITYRGVSF